MNEIEKNANQIEITFPQVLMGQSISLTPVRMEGLQDFHEYSTLPELYEHLEFSPSKTLEETRYYLEKLIKRSDEPDAQYWFIQLLSSEKIVGTVGLHSLDLRRGSIEVGYGISPAYWRRGIFTEVGKVVLDLVFNDFSLHRIVARTSTMNAASIAGLKKLGFTAEGVFRDYYRDDVTGVWFDCTLYSKLRTDK